MAVAVEAVAAGLWAALQVGDSDRLTALLAPDLYWDRPAGTDCAPSGRVELVHWYRQHDADGARITVGEVTVHDQVVIIEIDIGPTDAAVTTTRVWQVFHVRDGTVHTVRDHTSRAAAHADTHPGLP